MITGYTQLQVFDSFINEKYKQLKKDARRICHYDSTYSDILTDNVIKVRNRISSGFTVNNYNSYLYVAIANDYKLLKKRANRRQLIPFEDPTIQNELEEHFERLQHDKHAYHAKNDKEVRYLFQYLEKTYGEKKATLFKTYYLTSAKTYTKLVISTGYTFKYIKQTICDMKKDVKKNLRQYIQQQEQSKKYNR